MSLDLASDEVTRIAVRSAFLEFIPGFTGFTGFTRFNVSASRFTFIVSHVFSSIVRIFSVDIPIVLTPASVEG